MKKIFLFIMLSFISVAFVQAQKMTDDQVVEYVVNAQEEGESQQQIAKDLLRRGVTMEQINRIKRRMDNSEGTGIGKTLNNKARTRTAPQQNGVLELQQDKDAMLKMSLHERETMISDGIGFMFPDSAMMYMMENSKRKEIFGHRIFQNKEVAFEASYNLPTPANYKLGPGDEVAIDIWGASQTSLRETISPDGNIYVENLGPVYLSGLTVKQANSHLKEKFGQIYSGINSEEPNSNISLSLAQNRTIQVHVMGEVVNPGTYTMSSFSTIFNALYQAGGVSEHGTLRAVKMYRNKKEVAVYDVYGLILNGNPGANDIRLEDNDVVVVDAYENLVHVTGAVKRPMYYEMLEGESLAQVLKYAGGLSENAYKGDVRVERNGKFEREIYTLSKEQQQGFHVLNGDVVSVDTIQSTYSNMVEVRGVVYRPGKFQLGGSVTTVKELIAVAGGLKDEAFLHRAMLERRNSDNTILNVPVDLQGLMDGTTADIPLSKNDVLVILDRFAVQEFPTISIDGEVAFPGTYEYRDNMTVEDLVLLAGGLKDAASSVNVEVARRIKNPYATNVSDTIAEVFSLTLNHELSVVENPDFLLSPFDEVSVRKSPVYSIQEKVLIEGEVLFSGTYSLPNKGLRISQLIEKSGGFTPYAYPHGARLERLMTEEEHLVYEESLQTALRVAESKEDSMLIQQRMNVKHYNIAIDLNEIMENPGSLVDIILRDGDRLHIPKYTNVVKVNGEVMYTNSMLYQKKKSLKYYINQAGGFTEKAAKNNVYVVYMNGSVSKAKRMSRSVVEPGCEIIVPMKEERERMSASEVLSLSSTSASLATVVLALINVFR